MSLKRDEHGIICQHDPNVPDYMDGGDSDARTALMALSGSAADIALLPEFFTIGVGLVRHPFQEQWDDVSKTSRDQLVQYASGCYNNATAVAKALQAQYQWRVNKDILLPDVRNHLRLCAGMRGTLLGYAWLQISIYWASKHPDEEINQLLSMCLVAGPFYTKLFCARLPHWRENLRQYWGGFPFRDQMEIAEALIAKVELELAK